MKLLVLVLLIQLSLVLTSIHHHHQHSCSLKRRLQKHRKEQYPKQKGLKGSVSEPYLQRTDFTYQDAFTPLRLTHPSIGSLQHHGYQLFLFHLYLLKHCHFRLSYALQGVYYVDGYNCMCALQQQGLQGDHQRCDVKGYQFHHWQQKLKYQGEFHYDCDLNEIHYYYALEIKKGDFLDCSYYCVDMFMDNVNVQRELPTEAERPTD